MRFAGSAQFSDDLLLFWLPWLVDKRCADGIALCQAVEVRLANPQRIRCATGRHGSGDGAELRRMDRIDSAVTFMAATTCGLFQFSQADAGNVPALRLMLREAMKAVPCFSVVILKGLRIVL